ncbi:MAG: hypothetical protein ACUVXA_16955 [Candidatus Jordarchaeum sp.]|uniref:hypothetical protein n=1 Tax=Candidatus Jordarchaeum sp. TaxID=2823881 RepID=UPI00404B6F26
MHIRNYSLILAVSGIMVAVAIFWGWPFEVAEIGGGPSILIYLILIIGVGIPVILVELGLGSWSKSIFPKSLKMINSKLEFFGWFAVINTFWLLIGLSAILSWSAGFAYYSLTRFYPLTNWLNPLEGSFDFVNFFFNFGSSLLPMVGLAIIWVSILLLLKTSWASRVRRIAVRIVLPALAIVLFIIFALTVFLSGGVNPGLNFYLGFDPTVFLSGSSWRTLITIMFFNQGAGLGVLSFYSSKIPKSGNNLTSSSIIIPLLGTGLIFLGGMVFFTMNGGSGLVDLFGSTSSFPMRILGFPAAPFLGWSTGFAIIERVMGPIISKGLAFLFYTLIFIIGVIGLSLIIEPVKETLETKFNFGKRKFLAAFVAVGFLASIPFSLTSMSPWGFYLTSLSNWWVVGFGLTSVILVELIAVGWIWGADNAIGYINNNSLLKIPKWFKWIIKLVAPGVCIIALIIGILDTLYGYVFYSWGFFYPLISFWQMLSPWYVNLNFVFLFLIPVWLASNLVIAFILTKIRVEKEGSRENV